MGNKDELLAFMIKQIPSQVLKTYGITIFEADSEKKSMFKTEDGVEKYPGDSWFYINKHGVAILTSSTDLSRNPNFITKRYHCKDKAIRDATLLHEANIFSLSDLNDVIANGLSNKEIREKLRAIAYEKI